MEVPPPVVLRPATAAPTASPAAAAATARMAAQWRIVVQPQIGPNENTADNGSSDDSVLKWCLTLPPSLTDGHNHTLDYVHNKAVVAAGDGSSRIITKADLTEEILSDARTWSSVPTVHCKALHNAALCHHFGGDLKAVFEPAALNTLNNIAADVRARAAFTKGDSKHFIAALNDMRTTEGYAVYDLAEDYTFRRAFWATQDQVERANEFGLDVIMQTFKHHLHRASRAPTEECFDAAWDALGDALGSAGAADAEVLGYLDNTIYPIRRRWAFCFRIGILILGINSTQRCEGYFGLIKAELVKLGTLTHLLETLARITHKYNSDDAIYMAATNRALDVAMKEVDPVLRIMYSSLLDVAQQDGTLHCLRGWCGRW
ncbi:hypothetical protein JKP88DRAFT_295097 [Tribonema minus]|uniref:Uncharacterized protein n=1 Tax=Tribonema minus TaxID=303371 RepID=A0A835ZDE2_9STRA|nr:hypothetical protein JKP88DRAFT_295097 [Tribonema minus]